jgi:hypothetical protein
MSPTQSSNLIVADMLAEAFTRPRRWRWATPPFRRHDMAANASQQIQFSFGGFAGILRREGVVRDVTDMDRPIRGVR